VKQFKCPVCNKEYSSEKRFENHLRVHFETDANGSVKAVFKFKGTPPREVVEAMLVDVLSEMYKSLQVTAEEQSKKLTMLQSFRVAMRICVESLELANDCLQPCNPKTLNMKHRQMQRVVPAFLLTLSACEEVCKDAKHEDDCVNEGKLLVSLIRDYHLILSENTSDKDRKELVDVWCESAAWGAQA